MQREVSVDVQKLCKNYPPRTGWRRLQKGGGGRLAVRDVDFTVYAGELFGLLGPNGAGKTTLVKMLSTLILPTSGSATVVGLDLAHHTAEIRAKVGLVVTDERSFYWRLSARRNLLFFAAMHNLYGREAMMRVDETLDAVDLLDRAETRFSEFSSGMKQRMAIARGLLHRPKLVFLDEPTRSLDPIATQRLHDLIFRVRAAREMTVFLITHDMSEAEKLCDRVAIMHEGRLLAVGSSADLRRQLRPHHLYTVELDSPHTNLVAECALIGISAELIGLQLHITLYDEEDQLTRLIDLLRGQGIAIRAIHSHLPTLEQLFAQITASP